MSNHGVVYNGNSRISLNRRLSGLTYLRSLLNTALECSTIAYLLIKWIVIYNERINKCRSPSGQRRPINSLCVLSPFDEQEEWIKILEILSSCNSGFNDGDSNLVDEVQREFQNRIGESIFRWWIIHSVITFQLVSTISFYSERNF